jgi:hypothetical protein
MAWNKFPSPISGIYLEFKGQILTEEFAVDLGSGLCWGKLKVPCLQQVTDVFHVKNKKGCYAVAFCVYKKMQLFSAVFYAVRAVDKFKLTFVINGAEKNTMWR